MGSDRNASLRTVYGNGSQCSSFFGVQPDRMLRVLCACPSGRDATDDFEDIGHSSDARKMLEEYYIGDLDPASVPDRVAALDEKRRDLATAKKGQSESSIFMLILQILVPIAIIGLAIAVRIITAPKEGEASQ